MNKVDFVWFAIDRLGKLALIYQNEEPIIRDLNHIITFYKKAQYDLITNFFIDEVPMIGSALVDTEYAWAEKEARKGVFVYIAKEGKYIRIAQPQIACGVKIFKDLIGIEELFIPVKIDFSSDEGKILSCYK